MCMPFWEVGINLSVVIKRIYPPIHHQSINQSIYLSVCLPACLSVCYPESKFRLAIKKKIIFKMFYFHGILHPLNYIST
jgi:hypothetical protein